jgi:hypothetical protein
MLGLPFNGTLASSAIQTERRNEMAVAIIQRCPEGVGAAEYDPVADRLKPEGNPPGELILHCAAGHGRGGWKEMTRAAAEADRTSSPVLRSSKPPAHKYVAPGEGGVIP